MVIAMEVIESPIESTPQAPQSRARYFTKENAVEMARRGAAASNAARIRRKQEIEVLMARAVQTPDEFIRERLARTRAQIAQLDEQILRCKDPKNVHFLTQSLHKLHDIEAKLRAGQTGNATSKPTPRSTGPLD